MIARVLHAGAVRGPVLHLEEPLSLWGGFDPVTGVVIDIHHPQRGAQLAGYIVLMRTSRGSGTSPGTLADSLRRGTGPLALVMVAPDANLAIGAAVAAELYGRICPVLTVSDQEFAAIATWPAAHIAAEGQIDCAPDIIPPSP